LEYQDIIPRGLEDKSETERQRIIACWERLFDEKQAVLEGKPAKPGRGLPVIEWELAELAKLLEPREPLPKSGILIKEGRKYLLCPRCGTFVQLSRERIEKLAIEFKERPDRELAPDKYLVRSLPCPICRWGLGLPEGL
jgi:hypothetical protein